MNRTLCWLGVCLAILLAGCAGQLRKPVPQEPRQAWQAREQVLRQLTQWNLRGRIAVRTPDDGFNANLSWRQWGENYHIGLSGPFGMAAFTLAGNGGGVALRRGGKTVLHRGDAESLFFRHTGVRLPIDALRYWVRGMPQPGVKARLLLDRLGRPKELEQAGWRVVYNRYTRQGGLELPAKLVAENRQLRVRLVIDRWSLPAPPVPPTGAKEPAA